MSTPRKRVIQMDLSTAGIDRAIREYTEWRQWLHDKTVEFLKALADEGLQIASARFKSAVYDGNNDVNCHMEDRGENTVAVVAIGETVLFIEFGSGVRYPDSHPEAGEPNTLHGSWSLGPEGKGHWDDPKGWYYAHNKKSWGNPANMCMYQTKRELENRFLQIAQRIYV